MEYKKQKFSEYITKLLDNLHSKFDGIIQIGLSLIPVVVYSWYYNKNFNKAIREGQYDIIGSVIENYSSATVTTVSLICITIFTLGLYNIITKKIFQISGYLLSFVVLCILLIPSSFIFGLISGYTIFISILPTSVAVLIILLRYLLHVSIGFREDISTQNT